MLLDSPSTRADAGVDADDGPAIVVIERRALVRDGLMAIARDAHVGSVHGAAAIPSVPVPWISPLLVLLGLSTGDDPAALVAAVRERIVAPVACALFCNDPDLVVDALAARTDGYLLIDLADSDTIVDLVGEAQVGRRSVPPEFAAIGGRRGSASILSRRCLEVLRCLAAGQHDDEIAHALSISASCVRKHIRTAEERLHARTRAEALAMAIRAGIL